MMKISSIYFNLDLKMKSFIRMIQYTVRYRYYTNPFLSWQNEKTEIKIQTKRRSTLNTTDIFGTIIHRNIPKQSFKLILMSKHTHVVFRYQLNYYLR